MLKFLPKKRSTRLLVFLWSGVALIVIAILGYYYVAKPGYKSWREKRANSIAREHLANGNYPEALAAARKAIQYNQSNVDAWKLAVEITEKQESPQTFVFQQGLAGVQPTLENKLKYIRTAIKYNAYPQAFDAINKIGAEASESVEFYELAAQVSLTMRNPTKAKYYLMSLVKLRPEDNKARLDLAQIRLIDGFDDNKPSIRSEIRSLASDPALRVRALTLLLADAVQTKSENDALDIANQLSLLPELPVSTQLMVAEAYRQTSPKRFVPYLEKLQASYAEKPAEIAVLINYLGTHELFAEARKWVESLPPKIRDEEGVQMGYAAILLTTGKFQEIQDYLRPLKWTENEYARHAFLAYAARKLGDERTFGEAWRLAMIEAGNTPRRLQSLLSRVAGWGWHEQRVEILWKKFSLDPSDKTTRQQIGRWERDRQNTAALNRLFGRINENEPGDRDSKNNYTYTSLLLGTSLDRAHTLARENYEFDPKNAYFATTYALSLFKQGKNEAALQVIESLDFGSLAAPERTLLHGIILIANGRIDEGVEQTSHLRLNQLLPEERRLYEEASVLVSRSRRDQANAARVAAFSNNPGASSGARKSWLQTLPASYRTANVQLELADSMYATDDYRGLESNLKNEKWDDNEFLRLALLTYAQRNLGKTSEALNNWRVATSITANRIPQLTVLESMCETWGWTAERLDILNRILQREPAHGTALAELAEHYRSNGQTAELARIYALRIEAEGASADEKSHFAYYSLLTNTNVSRANVLAKQSYDASPDNPFFAKAYAFSLIKQRRAADAWYAIEKLIAVGETGPAQLNLLRAAITLERGNTSEAKKYLENFGASSALPEEIALADTLARDIAAKNT